MPLDGSQSLLLAVPTELVARIMDSVQRWTMKLSSSQGSWAGRTVCQTPFITATCPMT